jgi:N-acetylglucosamine kinase-like BadF-type ATPase
MKYIIGMDGGGTKTHCIITNQNCNILYECNGGPSNFLILGTEKVSETLSGLIKECITHLKIEPEDIKSIVIGTTGAGRRSDAEKLERDFISYAELIGLPINDFHVESDAKAALEGAFSGNPGCILIAGTGSIMFGKDETGLIHRVGGFGRFIGDEGSGFMLGKKGLIAVAKSFDGRGEKTILSQMVFDQFKIDSPELLITEIYRNNFDIASAAPILLEAAEKGDAIALAIIEQELDELMLHVKAMREKIKTAIMNISFIGGILSNDNIYSRKFIQKIHEQFKDVKIKKPDSNPAFGALLIAKKRADDLLKND